MLHPRMTATLRPLLTVVEDPEPGEVVLYKDIDGDKLQVGAQEGLVVPRVGPGHQQAPSSEDQRVVLTERSVEGIGTTTEDRQRPPHQCLHLSQPEKVVRGGYLMS